jgi:NAD(P)-dependent dehydrogenase (short-subunit alcohol dehydrogenase family)
MASALTRARAAEAAVAPFGEPDVLVNCAGVTPARRWAT